jgi:hypothetical protein
MIQYAKTVLTAISFQKDLFKKEYSKLIKWMTPDEARQFKEWCKHQFDKQLLKGLDLQ